MSSHIDIEALSAKVRRLEGLFETQQRESAAEPKDRAIQPAVSTGSSAPALQVEISRLQDVITAKDAEIASKDAQIERLYRKHSDNDLIKSITSFENDLNEMARDVHHTTEAAAAEIFDSPPEESTPMIEFTDTDRPNQPASSSPPKDVQGEGETKPKTPLFGLTRTNVSAFIAPTLPGLEKPNHSQVLQTPNAGPSFGNRDFPPVVGQGVFSGTKAWKPQTPSNQPKQTQFAKCKRASGNREQKGREGQKLERGLTSHDRSPKVHGPPTPRQAISETAQGNTSTNTRDGASAIKSADQLSRNSNIDLSVTASKLQIGQEVPVHKNKIYPNRLSDSFLSYIARTPGMLLDNEGNFWDAWKVKFCTGLRVPIPPEVKAAMESGALPVSTTDDAKDDSSVCSDSDSWDAASLQSVDSPAQKMETADSSFAKTSSLIVKNVESHDC